MSRPKPDACTAEAYGRIRTDRDRYRPLDAVSIDIEGRRHGDTVATVRVCDPNQRAYHEVTVPLRDNRGRVTVTAGGPLGVHYVYLFWPDEPRHRRYINFILEAQSSVTCGDADVDMILPLTHRRMPLGRREYRPPRGRFVGYISADTWHFDGIWLRDSVYGLPAYQHWEPDLACMLEPFLASQTDAGQVPDGIERDGRTWRVGLESDVEYILVLAAWQTWKATGDDQWLVAVLPKLEAALGYITSDARHWDAGRQLVKRQHSCDTWDFDIDGAGDTGQSRHVIATCDQGGYYLAFAAMAQMYGHLGKDERQQAWAQRAEDYRRRAVELLWDGVKFRHHVHLDPIDHGDFNESEQLAMGNTWAMTRGLASGDQARSIIDEYRRRHAATGDAWPWWSLQPGYPDHLGYFPRRPFCRQGGYANGGLMPWVGGELCRAAFRFGREPYGVELLRHYADLLRRTGGAQVWYWPDGTPGHRTTNEVNYAGWGMGQWIDCLFEGLAGISDDGGQLRQVTLSPRWAALGTTDAAVTFRYAPSDAYLAYRMQTTAGGDRIEFSATSAGSRVRLRLLLPRDWTGARTVHASEGCDAAIEMIDESRYAVTDLPVETVATIAFIRS